MAPGCDHVGGPAKPWIVNPTSVAYTNVLVCLGRGAVQPYLPALNWWTLPGIAPSQLNRALMASSFC